MPLAANWRIQRTMIDEGGIDHEEEPHSRKSDRRLPLNPVDAIAATK